MQKMLRNEYERAKRIHGGEATLIKLTRDYDVNQGIYQDLLKRLENARVSRNLDMEQQGLSFKIQEPAKVPLLPTGVRFIHFAIAGIVLGIAVPFGIMRSISSGVMFAWAIAFSMAIDMPLPSGSRCWICTPRCATTPPGVVASGAWTTPTHRVRATTAT